MMNLFNQSTFSTRPNFTLRYIEDYGHIYLPYFILNCIGIVAGTVGNAIVIITILFDRSLKNNSAYILMANLALSDVGISTFVHGFTNVGIILGEEFFYDRMGLCVFLGALCLVCCAASLINMGILAFNRYLNICHNNIYSKVFNKKTSIYFCILAWLAGSLIDVPNFVGWGGHFFDKKSANCMWNRLANESYSIFFPTTAIFIPCLLILVFYIKIFLYAFESKKRSKGKLEKKEIMQSLRVAQSLFASFLLFTFCWVPYGLIVAIDFNDLMPMELHATSTFLAHINSTMNPIFYILFNPSFKKSFRKLIIRQMRLGTTNSKENFSLTKY